jgi:hypothetical protein
MSSYGWSREGSGAGSAGADVEENSGGTRDCPGCGVDVERNRSGTVLMP